MRSPISPFLHFLISSALAAAALLASATPTHADSTVLLAEERQLEDVELKPGPTTEQVTFTKRGASPETVALRNLLVIDFGKIPGREITPTVRLVGGGQVFGKAIFTGPKQLQVSAGWGSFTVPLAWVSAVRFDEHAPMPDAVTEDTVVLAGDRVQGAIGSVSGGKLTITLSGKAIPVDLAKVKALALAPRAQPEETTPPAGLLLAIDLGGGERLSGRWVRLTEDLLTIRMAWGDTIDIPVASISRLEVKNGRLIFLSDVQPSEARHVPYLDGAFPHRADRAVSGKPLKLGGKVYARGIGVHSRSELTYTLDGSYKTFAAVVGIDDAVAGAGSAVFRVFGDDKLLFESKPLRGGGPPVAVKVEMKGVLLLRLEVDYADNGDIGDHADWGDAQLLRP